MNPSSPESPFRIVPAGQAGQPRPALLLLVLGAGLLLGALAGWWLGRPPAGSPAAAQADMARRLQAQGAQLAQLQQQVATLRRSDQISRDANGDLQDTLAERDAQIASLRADVAFYERFVGSGGERKGLGVHSAEFAREPGGSWRYQVVLTQSLNRGALSQGDMRLAVEGIRNGRLETVKWDALQQKPDAPAQHYAFRYFQRLEGSLMLPPGFTPQRVKVSLHGDRGTTIERAFPWTLMNPTGET